MIPPGASFSCRSCESPSQHHMLHPPTVDTPSNGIDMGSVPPLVVYLLPDRLKRRHSRRQPALHSPGCPARPAGKNAGGETRGSRTAPRSRPVRAARQLATAKLTFVTGLSGRRRFVTPAKGRASQPAGFTCCCRGRRPRRSSAQRDDIQPLNSGISLGSGPIRFVYAAARLSVRLGLRHT